MTQEEFKQQLTELDFRYDRYGEYNRDAYDNDHYRLVDHENKIYKVRLEIFIDYYTVRMVWWLDNSHKLSKCYYVNKEIRENELAVSVIRSFIDYCVKTYGVDIKKYEEK